MIRQIQEDIIDLLKNNIDGYLSAIDTQFGDTTPRPVLITSGESKGMYPEIFVDINSLEYEYITLNSKPDDVYQIEITITLKTNEINKIQGWASNYIEAIKNIFFDSELGKSTELVRADIIDINTKEGGYSKMVGMIIKIRG